VAPPADRNDAPSASELRAFAYRLLGGREYSVHELRRRLVQRWSGADEVEERVEALVDALVEENLLSDERFVESFVRSRVARHQGPLKIRAALREKGVEDSLIAAGLDSLGGEWTELALEWLQRQHAGPLDFETRKKYYRRLAGRGFTHDQAMSAMDRLGRA